MKKGNDNASVRVVVGRKSSCIIKRRLDLMTVGSAIIIGILTSLTPAQAWGGNGDDASAYYAFGNSFSQDYIYDSKSISLKLGGCVYSPISGRAGGDKDGDYGDGCLVDDSEDGTTSWYQMSNCLRANAAFSFYASDSSNKASCSSSTFEESLITTTGLAEFVYYLQQYDANNPFGGNRRLDDYGYDNLPSCEQSDNGGYIGVGCGDDGSFVLEYFDDQYCLESSGQVYDNLKSLNKALKQYKSCSVVYSYGDDNNFPQAILPYTESCSSLDSSLCSDDSVMASRIGNANSFAQKSTGFFKNTSVKSWGTKLKYGLGSLLLFASFIMFTGILFTNRRRRRALMQRKFRQSSEKSRKSSRSKSRHRGDRDEKSRKSSRSKRSKSRSKRAEAESGGVYT